MTTDDLIRHWLFTTEYQWKILCNDDETAKSIAVIDLAGVKLTDLAGDNLTFMKKALGIANLHYPERSFVIYIVNAPIYFSMGWRLVKPMVHENTQKKIRILSSRETLKGLQEHIDFDQIPVYYGGGMDFGGPDSCRFSCPETSQITDYVKRLNDRNAIQNKVPFAESNGNGSGASPTHAQSNSASSPNGTALTSESRDTQPGNSTSSSSPHLPPGECGDLTNLQSGIKLPPKGIMKRGSQSSGPQKGISLRFYAFSC